MNILLKAILKPGRVIAYLRWRWHTYQVRRVEKDGKIFHEFKGELYPDELNHGNAQQWIGRKAMTYCQGKGIDVGADRWPFSNAIPVRNEPQQNAYKLDQIADGSLDYVFSSHCLEHLDQWQDALKLWIQKLQRGGVLFLYLPHESMKMWNPEGPWVGLGHKWQPKFEILKPFLEQHGMEIIDSTPGRDEHWSFHIVGRKK